MAVRNPARGPWAAGQAVPSRSGRAPGGEDPRYVPERQRRHRGPRFAPCPPSVVPLCSWCPVLCLSSDVPRSLARISTTHPLSTLQARQPPHRSSPQQRPAPARIPMELGGAHGPEEGMSLRIGQPPGPARQAARRTAPWRASHRVRMEAIALLRGGTEKRSHCCSPGKRCPKTRVLLTQRCVSSRRESPSPRQRWLRGLHTVSLRARPRQPWPGSRRTEQGLLVALSQALARRCAHPDPVRGKTRILGMLSKTFKPVGNKLSIIAGKQNLSRSGSCSGERWSFIYFCTLQSKQET